MKEIIFGESLKLDEVNKNGRRYNPEQIFLDTSDIKYNIMDSKSIVYRKIVPDNCSYSGRGSFYPPILSNTDMIYLFRKWHINDLVKEGKVKDAIKLLLEGRVTKYPRLEYDT